MILDAGNNPLLDSIPVLQPSAGLSVVTGLTKRLPVRLIPEELVVAAMRNDVVNDRRGDDALFS